MAPDEVGVVGIAPINILLVLPRASKFDSKGTGVPILFVGLSSVMGDIRIIGSLVVIW